MQFKHPELLWALLFLLIPLIIHLFQLRRFKKTPFTNVQLLQRVVAESRRSSTIKKWLLLGTRMLLIAALVVAFAQPFSARKDALTERETVVYIDNSFSMQARKDNANLLETAVQDLIKYLPETSEIGIFTNDLVIDGVTLKDIQNDLLNTPFVHKQLSLEDIILKGRTLFSDDTLHLKDLIIISDFQRRMALTRPDSVSDMRLHLVQLRPETQNNVTIDTVYIGKTTPDNLEIIAELSSGENVESIPVSLFDGNELIAKTAAVFTDGSKAIANFTLPQDAIIKGKIEISDPALAYDNVLYFNLESRGKINIMAIGEGDSQFLQRIYRDSAFNYRQMTLRELNYSEIESQNMIIINEIADMPNALQNALNAFTANGGSLVLIPASSSANASYEAMTSTSGIKFQDVVPGEYNITGISFDHPLFQNVFEKKVTNFQFPKVKKYRRVRSAMPSVLTFQNNDPFLIGKEHFYLFSASLDSANSNFKRSPLIVPTFYSIATQSLKLPQLYHTIGQQEEIDIPVVLGGDHILKVGLKEYEFIPRQRYLANKTTLTFEDHPTVDGIFSVSEEQQPIQQISFNYPRAESELIYINTEQLQADSKNGALRDMFDGIEKDSTISELWKWFVILALFFLLTEIVIQRLVK